MSHACRLTRLSFEPTHTYYLQYFSIAYSVLPVYGNHHWWQRCYAGSCTLRVTTTLLSGVFVVAISEQTLSIARDETKCPGYPGTRLLDGYPCISRVPGCNRVPLSPPKIEVNTRECPGISPLKIAGIRLRRVLVG